MKMNFGSELQPVLNIHKKDLSLLITQHTVCLLFLWRFAFLICCEVPKRQPFIFVKAERTKSNRSRNLFPIGNGIENISIQQFLMNKLNKILTLIFFSDNGLIVNQFFQIKIIPLNLILIKFNQRKALLQRNSIQILLQLKHIDNSPILKWKLHLLIFHTVINPSIGYKLNQLVGVYAYAPILITSHFYQLTRSIVVYYRVQQRCVYLAEVAFRFQLVCVEEE